MNTTILLFDADGVLTLPEEVFSIVYARSHRLDPESFENFFRTDWPQIVTGKKDLKESITEKPELWQWHGSTEELLDYWFKTEDVRNEELIALILELRGRGMPCYLVTDQEKYRAEYMKKVMFKDVFDGYFISAELGVTKTDPSFFEKVIAQLQVKYQGLDAQDIIFFDDSQSKVNTACSVGVRGELYKNVAQVKSLIDKRL